MSPKTSNQLFWKAIALVDLGGNRSNMLSTIFDAVDKGGLLFGHDTLILRPCSFCASRFTRAAARAAPR